MPSVQRKVTGKLVCPSFFDESISKLNSQRIILPTNSITFKDADPLLSQRTKPDIKKVNLADWNLNKIKQEKLSAVRVKKFN